MPVRVNHSQKLTADAPAPSPQGMLALWTDLAERVTTCPNYELNAATIKVLSESVDLIHEAVASLSSMVQAVRTQAAVYRAHVPQVEGDLDSIAQTLAGMTRMDAEIAMEGFAAVRVYRQRHRAPSPSTPTSTVPPAPTPMTLTPTPTPPGPPPLVTISSPPDMLGDDDLMITLANGRTFTFTEFKKYIETNDADLAAVLADQVKSKLDLQNVKKDIAGAITRACGVMSAVNQYREIARLAVGCLREAKRRNPSAALDVVPPPPVAIGGEKKGAEEEKQ